MTTDKTTYHLDQELQFKKSEMVMFQELDGETVLLNLVDESYYTLNESGTLIWTLLDKSTSTRDAYLAFQKNYDLDDPTASTDFNALIEDLTKNQFGILEKKSP
ncbi:PqqD family protein [Verrucomicrobia bacterium]|jgi:hypothetical protein|nr:PqqD family protein [Verrucomicrobiota bacterium]